MYLLDTNVVSEFAKRRADAGVTAFMEQARAEATGVFLSVLTVGEIRKGIDRLIRYRDYEQADKLQHWLARLKDDYADAMLAVDTGVSELWGAILAATDDTNAVDKLMAATALQYDLTLVTRNTDHVAGTGVKCINPFGVA